MWDIWATDESQTRSAFNNNDDHDGDSNSKSNNNI